MAGISLPRNDRDLHDDVIRYLSDAGLRSVETSTELLSEQQAERAQRFSRFLARRYYRDRLSRAFRYSAMLDPNFAVADITESPDFDSILDQCVLGSLTTSLQVADLARSHMAPARSELWWGELLEYERAFFLQLATSEILPVSPFPARSPSAVFRRFGLRVPELLTRLKSGAQVGDDLDGATALLFSRTVHGKIYVVELDEITAGIFESIDGSRTANEIATLSCVSPEEIQRILAALADIGSVVLPN